jgi:hypothetical protein
MRLTEQKKHAIIEALKLRVVKDPDGYCHYINPNDGDEVVATEFGVDKRDIERRRTVNIGKLRKGGDQRSPAASLHIAKRNSAKLEVEVAELRALVEHLYNALGEPLVLRPQTIGRWVDVGTS